MLLPWPVYMGEAKAQWGRGEVWHGPFMDSTWAAPTTGCLLSTSVRPGSREGLYLEKQPAIDEWYLR